MILRVKSQTDVITNSSSEVFNYVSEVNVRRLKELIDVILGLSHSPRTCDDLFDISLDTSEGVELYEEYGYPREEWDTLSEFEKLDFFEEHADEQNPIFPKLVVKPKEGVSISGDDIELLERVGELLGGQGYSWC